MIPTSNSPEPRAQLPLELIHIIIEQLADLQPELHACTLVCKAWHPIALRVLFHDFTLRTDRPDDLHAGLTFPHYVFRLNISSFRRDRSNGFEDTLSLFGRAQAIRLSVLHSTRLIPLIPTTFPRLRDLDLFVIPFPDAYTLHTLLSALPNLERISVYYIHSNETRTIGDDGSSNLPPPSRLHTLSYNSFGAHRIPLLNWLSGHPPALQHLTFLDVVSSELPSVGGLLSALGPCLRTLDISFKDEPTYAQISACLPPHPRPHLHSLRISLFRLPHRFGMHVPLALLDFDSPALRCVALNLSHGYNYHFPLNVPLEWDDLDVMLARRAPALECLHVNIYNQPLFEHSPHMRKVLEAQMPHCLRHNILHEIDFVVDSSRRDGLPLHD